MTSATENMSEIHLASLQAAIPDPLIDKTDHYQVIYGIRTEDRALVFHFFPPEGSTDWPSTFDPQKVLTPAITALMDSARVFGDYSKEVNSFCVIYRAGGLLPAPFIFARQFLDRAESLARASGMRL
jgi:hypothetical protein